MEDSEAISMHARELSVSFGYHFNGISPICSTVVADEFSFSNGDMLEKSCMKISSSFSCLSGAALSANATLANTNICNGIIGEEILPSLDSPKSFRRLKSSPSLSRLDLAPSNSHSSVTTFGGSAPMDSDLVETEGNFWKYLSSPTKKESSSFFNAMDMQMAGGAAGEDRVQAVCSEGHGWLFCAIYDGFNGRDAADFLAGTLYENIGSYLHTLDSHKKMRFASLENTLEDDNFSNNTSFTINPGPSNSGRDQIGPFRYFDECFIYENFQSDVIECLKHAVAQAESDFMHMVEQEMEDRPDLVSVGSCILVVLLYGDDIYVANLGDSRAILATYDMEEDDVLKAIQLTETHTVDNEIECRKIVSSHPEDASPIIHGRVKGKLKLTRAFGVGYLKKGEMNDALMGILRVQDLSSPPYIDTHPFTTHHRVSKKDQFVVLGSDGLFDFFNNEEVVQLVHLFIQHNPSGDPAKHLVERLVQRAADNAGFSAEDLMRIPTGRRRKYHDDVTVIVVILGNKQWTSAASTSI